MGDMRARRRIAGLTVLVLVTCALAGAAASAIAEPHACCPVAERSDAGPPASPCTSLVPTPCCGGGLAGHTPPLPPPPAALPAAASAPAPAAVAAAARAPGARAACAPARAPLVLRL
jgi:hypothetical protein